MVSKSFACILVGCAAASPLLSDVDEEFRGDKSPMRLDAPDGYSNGPGGLIIFIIVMLSFLSLTMFVSLLSLVAYFIRKRFTLSEDDLIRREENQVYLELESEEQELYFQSKDYLVDNPYLRDNLTLSQNLLIQEKGISAWEFIKDPMLSNDDLLILNKYELNFFKKFECSTQTTLPIPMKNDVYYFESKIYSLPDPDNTMISIGIGIRPYPWFRLPGRHAHSVSYDSSGFRRHNQPLHSEGEPPMPKFVKGDVIGVGYRVRSGTVFFTRNGKKVSESKLGGHIKNFKVPNAGQLFPIIGANNLCSVHVNLGQMGFVFIEGNVKKWGFAPIEGNGPPPPAYNKFNSDILLERSEISDNEISEREDDFPPDFWQTQSDSEDFPSNDKYSYNAYSDVNSLEEERITLNSLLPPNRPPSYNSESDSGNDSGHESGNDSGHESGNESDNELDPESDDEDELEPRLIQEPHELNSEDLPRGEGDHSEDTAIDASELVNDIISPTNDATFCSETAEVESVKNPTDSLDQT